MPWDYSKTTAQDFHVSLEDVAMSSCEGLFEQAE